MKLRDHAPHLFGDPTPTPRPMREEAARLIARVDAEESIRRRAVQEALSSIHAGQLRRRANRLRDALPKPGDYPGGPCDWATGTPLAPPPADPGRSADLAAAADALDAKATLLEMGLLDA